MASIAYYCRQIFDGYQLHKESALLTDAGHCTAIVAANAVPAHYKAELLDAWCLAPGFVDLQVNGGGGIQFNQAISVDAIKRICRAHRNYGTTSLLVTLITDTPENTSKAIDCAIEAWEDKVPGFFGLHLEGPHLSIARKGAHRADLIREMTEEDLALLLQAKKKLSNLMVTIAPESVTHDQVARMAAAGICISLGHTDCSFETANQYAAAGATMVTHLFNAMSQLNHRAPGLAAAAMMNGQLSAGMIADGIHVHPEMVRLAVRNMGEPLRLFIVTDAMASIGTDIDQFELNGRSIFRTKGKLTLEDGTLAGADIDMASSVKFMRDQIGLDLAQVLTMATSVPALLISGSKVIGTLSAGSRTDLITLSEDLTVEKSWIAGE